MLAGTHVLWPEWESYYDLMVMREREGRASFQAEKQNEPLDPHQCIFSEASIHYWDDEYQDEQALLAALGSNGRFYAACDPSLGNRTGKGDYTAIVILYQLKDTKIKYVLGADIARRSPDATIERILHYARMYRFEKFGVEANQFQSLMVDNLERRANEVGVRLRVKAIESRCPWRKLHTPYRTETSVCLSVRRMSVAWINVQADCHVSPVAAAPPLLSSP